MHVHMVGNGFAGSGGWLHLRGWHRALAGFMLRQLGMPASALEGDLENFYAEHLLRLIAESSLDAVVLLAHEQVYAPDGTLRYDLGSMFVPNDVVLDLSSRNPQFLAGVSIHPARPDALDELDRCIAHGAVLMKCLPELPEYRSIGPALLPLLEKNGECRFAFARAHWRRAHSAGGQRGLCQSALIAFAA